VERCSAAITEALCYVVMHCSITDGGRCDDMVRIWINGKFSAFQADDMGSIPIIRSLCRDMLHQHTPHATPRGALSIYDGEPSTPREDHVIQAEQRDCIHR
jgi:hypothetical protein